MKTTTANTRFRALNLLWVGLLAAFLTTACGKSTPSGNLTGDSEKSWRISDRIKDGVAQGLDVCDRTDEIKFKKGGTVDVYDRYADSTGCKINRFNGTWALSNGDKDLKVTLTPIPGLNVTVDYTILELTSTKMRLKNVDSTGTWETILYKI